MVFHHQPYYICNIYIYIYIYIYTHIFIVIIIILLLLYFLLSFFYYHFFCFYFSFVTIIILNCFKVSKYCKIIDYQKLLIICRNVYHIKNLVNTIILFNFFTLCCGYYVYFSLVFIYVFSSHYN